MIEVSGISKSFGEIQVLNHVSLTVTKGEIVSIVGKSGAGKTTLLQIIGTLSLPDKGTVAIDGHNILQLNEKRLAKFRNRHIGFVFQSHQLLPEFTAVENVCMPALIGGTKRSDAEKRAKELLQLLGVSHRLEHKPAQLSGGEQQRVAVARSLINNPSVVLADEPSGNLDTHNKNELHQLFFDLRRELNQTFVIVTHDTGLASMSDRVIQMKDGEIV